MELLRNLPSCLSLPPGAVARIACLVIIAVPVFVFDLRLHRIPNAVSVPFLLFGGLVALALERPAVHVVPARLIVGLLAPLSIRRATRSGLGMGDVRLSAGIAVLIGFIPWGGALIIGSLFALICFAATGQLADPEAGLPFGPFLVVGAIAAEVLAEVVPW